jgi:hypothetical protein
MKKRLSALAKAKRKLVIEDAKCPRWMAKTRIVTPKGEEIRNVLQVRETKRFIKLQRLVGKLELAATESA